MHFCITSSAEMVMLDGVLATVTDALWAKRKQNPNASLAYQLNCHSDDVLPSVCVCVTGVCFSVDPVPPGGEADWERAEQGESDHGVPRLSWESLKMCKITWMVKWAVNGETPVRPVISWSCDFEIKAGEAVVTESSPKLSCLIAGHCFAQQFCKPVQRTSTRSCV